MANYCSNWVTFSGKKENLQKLHDALRYAESLNAENDGLIWYETFYAALGLDVPTEQTDVYDMFGSKWLHIDDIDVYDTELELIGSSAWSPVVPFVALLCEKFKLTAKGEYDESGCDFGGFYSVDEDNNVKEDTYNYLSYRYLSEGIEGVLSELSFYESFDDKIERLNDIKGYISMYELEIIIEEIKHEHNNSI